MLERNESWIDDWNPFKRSTFMDIIRLRRIKKETPKEENSVAEKRIVFVGKRRFSCTQNPKFPWKITATIIRWHLSVCIEINVCENVNRFECDKVTEFFANTNNKIERWKQKTIWIVCKCSSILICIWDFVFVAWLDWMIWNPFTKKKRCYIRSHTTAVWFIWRIESYVS